MRVNMDKTNAMLGGECQKLLQQVQDSLVVSVVEMLVVIQYRVLFIRIGYTRSVVI